MERGGELGAVWAVAVEAAKKAAIAPAHFRALEQLVPLAWEGDEVVLGMDPAVDGSLHTAIRARENLLRLEAEVRRAFGSPTAVVRLIEGNTPADWVAAKARDAAAKEQAARLAERRAVSVSSAAGSWDTVHDQINKLWATYEHRNILTGKGRFVVDALDLVAKAAADIAGSGESEERAVSRILERIASCVNTDATWVSVLYADRTRRTGNV